MTTKQPARNLDLSLFEPEFVGSYIHEHVQRGEFPDYGYSSNCLPTTDGKKRSFVSSFFAAEA